MERNDIIITVLSSSLSLSLSVKNISEILTRVKKYEEKFVFFFGNIRGILCNNCGILYHNCGLHSLHTIPHLWYTILELWYQSVMKWGQFSKILFPMWIFKKIFLILNVKKISECLISNFLWKLKFFFFSIPQMWYSIPHMRYTIPHLWYTTVSIKERETKCFCYFLL